MLEVSAHAFTCDAIFPMVIFLHDVFMYIEMIMLHPALLKVLYGILMVLCIYFKVSANNYCKSMYVIVQVTYLLDLCAA